MDRFVVALDAAVGVSPAEFAAAWNGDDEALVIGKAAPEAARRGEYGADVLELVVIPLLVNLGSSAAYDLVRRLIAKVRTKNRPIGPEQPDLELIQVERADGNRILIVRQRGTGS